VATVDQRPPRQQLSVLCLPGERVGRRLARLGVITVAKVELQARQQGRGPAAGDQQVPVLGEGDPALKELGEKAQALLHARDQHGRPRSGNGARP
jgi:hypothetical protein